MSTAFSFQISPKLKQAFVETCRQKNLDVRVVLEKFIKDFVSQFTECQLDIEDWARNLNRKYLTQDTLSGNEKLMGNLTVEQYLKLAESRKDRLWDDWYREELEKDCHITARNVKKDALTT